MSDLKNGDLPAMPIELNGFGQYAPEAHTGLTKREMFAMHAMQGFLSMNEDLLKALVQVYRSKGEGDLFVAISKSACEQADALLKGLENNNE